MTDARCQMPGRPWWGPERSVTGSYCKLVTATGSLLADTRMWHLGPRAAPFRLSLSLRLGEGLVTDDTLGGGGRGGGLVALMTPPEPGARGGCYMQGAGA
jgi:hypothetical protein